MTIKVGINGFGRIGRFVFRASIYRPELGIQVVGINDLLPPDYMAYMLKFDTMHGAFQGKVEVKDGNLIVNGNTIRVTAERDPANLKWGCVLVWLWHRCEAQSSRVSGLPSFSIVRRAESS